MTARTPPPVHPPNALSGPLAALAGALETIAQFRVSLQVAKPYIPHHCSIYMVTQQPLSEN